MESKHTQGRLTVHSGCIYLDGPNVWPKGDDTGSCIALMDRENPKTYGAERDDNARELVRRWNAFEPGGEVAELLAALEGLVSKWDAYQDRNVAMKRKDWEAARAAIAKAKGQS